jgi:hypothetical protein
MKSNYNVDVTLSASEVESILLEHIRNATGLDVTTCTLKFKEVHKGGQLDSWTETAFDSVILGGAIKSHKQFHGNDTTSIAS